MKKSENVSEINADAVTDTVDDATAGGEADVPAAGEGAIEVGVAAAEVATAADPGAAAVRILKTATCPSLSGKSTLTYAIGANSAGELGFSVLLNSGKGLFNRQIVPAASIKALIDNIPKGLPVRSSTLAPLFVHKSTNTPGFLLAALLSEGLLRPLPDKARCYQLTDPTAFIAEINALLETPVDVAAKPKPATSTKKATLSLKSKSKKAA